MGPERNNRTSTILRSGASIGDDLRVLAHLTGSRRVDIYLCKSRSRRELVACKVLREELRSDPIERRAIQREAEAVRCFDHPNVIQGLPAATNGLPCVVLEYLEGETLENVLFQGNYDAFDSRSLVAIALQVADALEHVHERGYLHLDVKPGNVQYDDGHVVLFDFSLARAMQSKETPLRDSSGTCEYMAPEQTFLEALGPATDVFGLGVLTYRMVTGGRLPYPVDRRLSEGDEPRCVHHYRQTPPTPSEVNPNVSHAVSQVVMQAIEPDPLRRIQSCQGFRAAMQLALSE